MRVQLVHIKAATEGDRIGTLQCLNGFIRKRIMEHLEKLKGVQNIRRVAWDIVYFETKDGIKAQDVLNAVHVVVPIFAAEMDIYPRWLVRNFWILWALAFGTCRILDTIEYYMDGGTAIISGPWLAGFVIVCVALINYAFQRRHYEHRAAFIRRQCVAQLEKHLNTRKQGGQCNV